MGDLSSLSIPLWIMAAVSVLQAFLLIGIGVAGYVAYSRVMTLVNELEARQIAPIREKVEGRERLTADDGLTLYRTADLLGVGWMANRVRERLHGNTTYFNVNRHINPTDVCVASCRLCAFGKRAKDPKAYTMSLDQVWEVAGHGWSEAVTEFRRVLGLDPDFHAALNYLGYMYAERGENLDEARSLVERAVALEPDNGAYVDSLGWVYFRLGRYEQARATLERATHLETADATVRAAERSSRSAIGHRSEASRQDRRRAVPDHRRSGG